MYTFDENVSRFWEWIPKMCCSLFVWLHDVFLSSNQHYVSVQWDFYFENFKWLWKVKFPRCAAHLPILYVVRLNDESRSFWDHGNESDDYLCHLNDWWWLYLWTYTGNYWISTEITCQRLISFISFVFSKLVVHNVNIKIMIKVAAQICWLFSLRVRDQDRGRKKVLNGLAYSNHVCVIFSSGNQESKSGFKCRYQTKWWCWCRWW